MKQLILTISPYMWEEYKAAVEKMQGSEVSESIVERVAQMEMWQALRNTIEKINNSFKEEGKNE